MDVNLLSQIRRPLEEFIRTQTEVPANYIQIIDAPAYKDGQYGLEYYDLKAQQTVEKFLRSVNKEYTLQSVFGQLHWFTR